MYKGFVIFIVTLIFIIVALWFGLLVSFLGNSKRQGLLLGLLAILPVLFFFFAKNKKRVNKNKINYIPVSNPSSELPISSIEKDGYDFDTLKKMFKENFEGNMRAPYNLHPSQAAGMFLDDFNLLCKKYIGFEQTMYVLLADIMCEHSTYSPYIHLKALKIITTGELKGIWESINVEKYEIKSRLEYVSEIKKRIICLIENEEIK
ncbi:hypothetical protein [Metabacillus litoralis]|uniref:hypothetical protein n=1 Tax=Metabacillus litoralis TaxID=152268 RepID=UPI001CFCBDC2|nr:hypothetical protein [Metabacillus litoralis]